MLLHAMDMMHILGNSILLLGTAEEERSKSITDIIILTERSLEHNCFHGRQSKQYITSRYQNQDLIAMERRA
jgi:hypothetical protein